MTQEQYEIILELIDTMSPMFLRDYYRALDTAFTNVGLIVPNPGDKWFQYWDGGTDHSLADHRGDTCQPDLREPGRKDRS